MNDMEQQKTPAYPNLGQSWGLFGYILLATVIFSIMIVVVYFVLFAMGQDAKANALLTSSVAKLIMYSVPFFVVVWLALKKKKNVEPGFELNFRSPSLLHMAMIALATWGIYFLIDPVVDLIPMPDFFKNLLLQLMSDHSVASAVMLVIAAPLFEELLFRGIILDGLLKHYSPTKAIIWSAVLFGLVHLNPWQFLAAVVLGIFMGWIYYRTGSLLTTIFIHFIANGTGTLLGWLLVPDPTEMVTTREMVGSNSLYFGLLAVDLVLVVILISALKKQLVPTRVKS